MERKIQKIAIPFGFVLALIVSCKKETSKSYDCSGVTPTYTTDVKPIIDINCATAGCHNATSKKDGKDYSTYELVKIGASSEAFMGSMQHLSGYKPMPKGGNKLSDEQLKTIYCWIQNGMPE
jgi:hypothetical protein